MSGADGSESVFSVARSMLNPESGWGLLWAWVESFVTGVRPSLCQGQGSSWDQGTGRSCLWSLPDPVQDSDFRRMSQAALLGAVGLRLPGWSRGSDEDDAPELMP